MSAKNKSIGGLGRGLDVLFAENSKSTDSSRVMLRISEIQPRAGQPRKHFDETALSSLADSIAKSGLLQPIIVRSAPGGYYEIIAGERRWRASRMAGLSEVPVVITECDDRTAAEMALIENIQREDLDPIEEAMGYRSLMDEFSLTQEAVSEKVGKSRSAIANSLRLLDLPSDVLALVANKTLSAGHAKALLGLSQRSGISALAAIVAEKELSVRATEELVSSENRRAEKAGREEKSEESADTDRFGVDYKAELERRIRTSLGRRVHIKNSGKIKKLELEYTDDADLEGLLIKLCGEGFFKE